MASARLDIHNSEVPQVCRSCEARHRGICGVLPPEQLVKLAKATTKQDVPAETEVAAAGEDVTRFANIMRGVAKLSKLTADGRQQIVGLQFAPDFLGRPFSRQGNVSIEAATDLHLCSFPRKVIEDIIREVPELEHKLYEQSLKELDEAREWMLTLGRKTAAEKVASFLVLLATHSNPEAAGKVEFDIPMKRSDIADFLGLTVETVSRQLTKLRQAGVILIHHNRTIEVPHLEKLKQRSETDRGD